MEMGRALRRLAAATGTWCAGARVYGDVGVGASLFSGTGAASGPVTPETDCPTLCAAYPFDLKVTGLQ